MSFLNPVNEPVTRFSSTDADAPQINYNSRVAGDVKAVLKACLVTGYGSTTSAGWSIVNEVDHVAEFVSPSAAMSDYRFGIDDSTTTKTDWYYQYKNVRTNPKKNAVGKTFSAVNKTHASNGWRLYVTKKGFYFVDVLYIASVADVLCRVMYFGQVKTTTLTEPALNIGFWHVGVGSELTQNFFSATDFSRKHYDIGTHTNVLFAGANIPMLSRTFGTPNNSAVSLTAELYLHDAGQLIAQQPGILFQDSGKDVSPYGIRDVTINERQMTYVCIGYDTSDIASLTAWSHGVLIYTDYWEY